jgi:hydrogenase 3 maturation protease
LQRKRISGKLFQGLTSFLFGAPMAGNVKAELENWLLGSKKIVVAGIGNPIRQDDYVGLKIVEALKGKVSKNVCLLECETVPESFLLDIEEFNPTHVLLIDAAFLGLKPGEARLLDPEKIVDFSSVSSHILPLRVFCEYVKQSTGAKIGLLLIEPKGMEFGEGLSVEVEVSAERLTKFLISLLC